MVDFGYETVSTMKYTVLLFMACSTANALMCASHEEFSYCISSLDEDNVGLYWKDKRGEPYRNPINLRHDLAGRGISMSFAMNAGMFKEDLSPMGLLVINGKQLAPINLRSGHTNFYAKPNGVFLVANGVPMILTTTEYQARHIKPSLATQSGPVLVKGGKVLTSSTVSPTSKSMYIRNAVCVFKDRDLAFVISDRPVTMYRMAEWIANDMKCPDALYLDGGVSMMYTMSTRQYEDGPDLGPLLAVFH